MHRHLTASFYIVALSYYSFAQNKIKEADSLFAKTKYREALAIYKTEAERTPKNIDLILKLAKTNTETINYTDALSCYDRIIELDAGQHIAYYEKAKLLNRLGFLKEALEELNKAIKISNSGEYYYWRGIVYQQLKNPDDAENDYLSAIEKKYEPAELNNNLAILLFEKGQLDQALQHINLAILSDPNYPEAFSARAKIHLALLSVDSACTDANTSSNMGYPNVIVIPADVCNGSVSKKLEYIAEMFSNNKIFSPAINAYTKLIGLHPDSSKYYIGRGNIYFDNQNWKEAKENFSKAVTLEPLNYYPVYMRGSCEERLEELKNSLADFTEAIRLNPKNEWSYSDRGLINNKLKNFKEAESDFNKALELKPNWSVALFNLGVNHEEQKEYDIALTYYNKAVKEDPTNAKAYNNIGYIYHLQKKFDLAIAHFDMALKISPDYTHALTNRAEAKLFKGDKQGACEDLHLALGMGRKDLLEKINTYCVEKK